MRSIIRRAEPREVLRGVSHENPTLQTVLQNAGASIDMESSGSGSKHEQKEQAEAEQVAQTGSRGKQESRGSASTVGPSSEPVIDITCAETFEEDSQETFPDVKRARNE